MLGLSLFVVSILVVCLLEFDNNQTMSDVADDLKIVGLMSNTNGRSCGVYHICGDHVVVGDVLHLVAMVMQVEDRTEEAIKVIKVVDGVDTCTVGFVPRVIAQLEHMRNHVNKFVQVKEIYQESKNTYK